MQGLQYHVAQALFLSWWCTLGPVHRGVLVLYAACGAALGYVPQYEPECARTAMSLLVKAQGMLMAGARQAQQDDVHSDGDGDGSRNSDGTGGALQPPLVVYNDAEALLQYMDDLKSQHAQQAEHQLVQGQSDGSAALGLAAYDEK